MIDKSKREIGEIQSIHDQLIEQNKDLIMESDTDMAPIQIEKVQTSQENTQVPAEKTKEESQPVPKEVSLAEKSAEKAAPEESGFKQFMRKWFKITW